MKWCWVLALVLALFLVACDSIEDRAVDEYRDCTRQHGLEAGMIGIARSPDGSWAITTPDLPEPAATECLRRATSVLDGD
ncbi:MAG: hypothetical protein OEP52_07260 [Acidimicrobiia bacterium]|nr:hypothetical protein [Acidimicrobiia bacterium]